MSKFIHTFTHNLHAIHFKDVGAKTKNLQRLRELGIKVPVFVAIGGEMLKVLMKQDGVPDKNLLKELVAEIGAVLKVRRFAVRSSALNEDSRFQSQAGQFDTVLDVGLEDLGKAILEVLLLAREKVQADWGKFSLIVQEFISGDYSGVTFTRSPEGGREMLMEYACGRGDRVVGGELRPKRCVFYWNQEVNNTELPQISEAVEIFKKIERAFDWPQDIEWTIRDEKWWFLQSRPITTLKESDYEMFKFLDNVLAPSEFFYEKTEISEIAPRPTPFTYDLLQKIYGDSGPVQRVYQKLGLQFKARDFLKIVGNELYVDRNQEVQTLFPSFGYSILKHRPVISRWEGVFRTLRNFWGILKAGAPRKGADSLRVRLHDALVSELDQEITVAARLEHFLKEYEIVFEVNFWAQKALKKLEMALKMEPVNVASLLSFPLKDLGAVEGDLGVDENFLKTFVSQQKWQGNSLEIADESDFVFSAKIFRSDSGVIKWWKSLAAWRQKYFLDLIKDANLFLSWRENGRWLTVKNLNYLGTGLKQQAEVLALNDARLMYFAKIEEISDAKINLKVCEQRRREYQKFGIFTLPSFLTNKVCVRDEPKLLGVSSGRAEGILLDVKGLEVSNDCEIILYTSLLLPQLTAYFGRIKGIVSEQGGSLSHLAIVAREAGIPVIVGFNLQKSGFKLGDRVWIDGNKGEVQLLTNA